ncbi:hypothetical protein JKP75_09280 [Blastococcus sp. TML/M2B]|uniref:hypothetical protein n=1 Tax=unclassified Blastococcus TaxID=2619396 RepID=UPI00190D8CD4|nr:MULTISPECIES: hypothetical protein [unclassified Blastococcus]MBN1092727.1 hypothetical protein [Blastococcus sp. TML/M2B]MBN1097161.1 hypothetical protein [Blastococcus sp. TML/C7B]
MSLAKEVELVRAALLYADEIEVVSPGAGLVASMADLADGDRYGLLTMLMSLEDGALARLPAETVSRLPQNWREILPAAMFAIEMGPDWVRRLPGGRQIDPAVLDQMAAFDGQFDGLLDMFREVADRLLEQSGGSELQPAIRAGVVTVSPLAINDAVQPGAMAANFVALLTELLENRRVRLLFDDSVAKLVRGLVDAGLATPHQMTVKHAGEAAVGSGFVTRLPAFTAAPVDELLDLRADLADPLARYRRGVSLMASKLAYRAYDEESAVEIEDLWRNEVDPALRDLREGFSEHGLVRELSRSLLLDLKTYASGLVGTGLWVAMDDLTSINGVIKAVGAAAPTAAVAAQGAASAAYRRHDARRQLSKHELFYLYEVENRLSAK